MKTSRVVALVIGCLLVLPGIAMLVGGGGLGVAYAVARGDDGYFDANLDRLHSRTPAITTSNIDFSADRGSPGWLLDALDADIRLRVTDASSGRAVFVGIGSTARVDAYLRGVARDEVIELHGGRPVYRTRSGGAVATPPTAQKFWAASGSGTGTRELKWKATSGRWTVVVMNASGSPGVNADINVGAKAGFILPLSIILLALGLVLTTIAVVLIVVGARGRRSDASPAVPVEEVPSALLTDAATTAPVHVQPLRLRARLDPELSRWQWLVKWLLAIPHFIVLTFLWIAFAVLTVVAGVSILFTGVYPRGIFDFNVGVMRWSWRVSYYAMTGGIGTDRYPPFSLEPDPDYPAELDLAYPTQLSRGLVLVKWWLLAIPHYLIVGVLVGGSSVRGTGVGLLGLLVLIAGVALLFRGRYPSSLFDLIIGCNRWVLRVVAYAALMTDVYPPFRLDQGGAEPSVPESAADAASLR